MRWLLFAIWILYGVIQTRRSDKVRAKVLSVPRRRRALLGAALIFGGTLGLFLGLFAVPMIPKETPWLAWTMIALLGLGFVHAITYATALLVTLAQTHE